MPLTWNDTERIAEELRDAHPEARPLQASLEELRTWAEALPELAGNPADDATLRAVQMLWYERTQADDSDVSG